MTTSSCYARRRCSCKRTTRSSSSLLAKLTKELHALRGGHPEQLKLQIAGLQQQLAKRNQMLFGDKSEKRSHLEEPKSEKAPQIGHGPRQQPLLPELEQVHLFDQADQVCSLWRLARGSEDRKISTSPAKRLMSSKGVGANFPCPGHSAPLRRRVALVSRPVVSMVGVTSAVLASVFLAPQLSGRQLTQLPTTSAGCFEQRVFGDHELGAHHEHWARG